MSKKKRERLEWKERQQGELSAYNDAHKIPGSIGLFPPSPGTVMAMQVSLLWPEYVKLYWTWLLLPYLPRRRQ